MIRIPLHPFLVHFPIAFYFLELVLLLFWVRKKDASYERFARFAFAAGYLFMLAAMVTGWRDAGGFGAMPPAVRRHFYGVLSIFALYTFRAAHFKMAKAGSSPAPRLAGAVAGNVLLFLTAYWGGVVVYA